MCIRDRLALHVLIFGGVEEVGMRIERAQHARDRALIDGLLLGDRVGVILFQQGEDASQRLETLVEIVLRSSRARPDAGAVKRRQHGAGTDDQGHLNRSPNFHEITPGRQTRFPWPLSYPLTTGLSNPPRTGAHTGPASLTVVDSANPQNGCKIVPGAVPLRIDVWTGGRKA